MKEIAEYYGLKLVRRAKRTNSAVQIDKYSITLLDGLNRENVTREQNIMEFIKCFLPDAKVEIERLTVEG